MPLLESIVGRESDALVMRDGRLIATGDEIFSGVAGVVEGQVVQEDFEEFVVKVVVARGYGLEQERQLQEALRRRVGAVKVEVRVVDALERTSSGKFRPVVSRLARPVG
jgi:phenylacetate-CoA ligase